MRKGFESRIVSSSSNRETASLPRLDGSANFQLSRNRNNFSSKNLAVSLPGTKHPDETLSSSCNLYNQQL